MAESLRTPVVPLEAGAGPENPPCPACGEPLFGWLSTQPGLSGPVSRCESCGLGVVGVPGGPEEALRELGTLGGWAGLVPGARYLFTVEAVRRLVARRDQVVKRSRWVPGLSLAATWQTLLNSVTFGHNVAIGASGRGRATPAKKPWQRRIDYLITLVLAIPALAIAIPIELAGGLFHRGAVIQLRFELL
jgi:hypothetical protein